MTTMLEDHDLHEPLVMPVGLREKQRRQREAAILEAAFQLITEKGYESMTMDDLAERAGISKPTLYNHFESKVAIAVRALVTLNERTIEAIQAIDPGLPPVDRLVRVIEWMVQVRFSPTPAALVRARPALDPARSHPAYVAAAARRVQAVTDIIAAGQAAGDIDSASSPKLLAHMLFNLACAPDYDAVIAEGDATPRQIAETVLRVFLGGITERVRP